MGFCITGVFRRERRNKFSSRLSLAFSAVETVSIGTIKCCCASWKFVPSIWSNSKERFLAVGIGCMKSSIIWGYVCFCCVCTPSSPLYLFLGSGGDCQSCYRDRSSWKLKKRSTCSEETYLRTDSPCIKIVSGHKILIFSAQERREVVKFLTREDRCG